MTTKSHSLGSSMHEIKEMLSKSRDNLDFLSTLKSDEQGTSSHNGEKLDQSTGFRTTTHDQPRSTKLDFPKYLGDDSTVWLNRILQYFDYQGTSKDCKVTLATFHLEGETNQWWQWMKKVYCKEKIEVTWENF